MAEDYTKKEGFDVNRKMKSADKLKIYATALIASGLSFTAGAQLTSSGYGFLDIPVSSHVHALGGVNSAIIDNDIMLVDQKIGRAHV